MCNGIERYNPVSPEYFSIVGIPIVRGRTFTRTETAGPPDSVIVTESTARRLWGGEDPIGKTLTMAFARNERSNLTIIGVAKDAQVSRVGETETVYMYVPAGPKDQQRAQVLVRSMVDFGSVVPAVRAAIKRLGPNLVVNVNRLEDNLEFWRSIACLSTGLSGALGGLALLLASIGVYGVVSYSVSWRIREIGIRMVLGAVAGEVVAMVLHQAMQPVLVGAAIGILACAAISRILSGVLFGISALDPNCVGNGGRVPFFHRVGGKLHAGTSCDPSGPGRYIAIRIEHRRQSTGFPSCTLSAIETHQY